MNIDELTDALAALSDRAPQQPELRRAVAVRVAVRLRRRRFTALIASVAAVLVVGASIGVATHRDFGSPAVAKIPDWQHERPVDLPAGSSLIRYQTPPLVSPVTANTNGQQQAFSVAGIPGGDQMRVAWPVKTTDSAGNSTSTAQTGGYLVNRSVHLGQFGPAMSAGTPDTTITTQNLTISGHPAVLSQTPANAAVMIVEGKPVRLWLTWQLEDGTYIHVWNSANEKAALWALAAGIVEHSQTFTQHLVMGVTLPGLTVVYREVTSNPGRFNPTPGALSLCPTGTTFSAGYDSPPAGCLTAVLVFKGAGPQQRPPGRLITVGGLKVHLLEAKHQGYADIGRGFIALVTAPPTMTAADIATTVASIRLDPQVCGIPQQAQSCASAIPTSSATPDSPAGNAAPSSGTR